MNRHRMLDGRTIVVTGANSGIGRQIALTLARCGADVAIHYLGDTQKVAGGHAL